MTKKSINHLSLVEIVQELKKDRQETFWWAKGGIDALDDLEKKICEVARNAEKV